MRRPLALFLAAAAGASVLAARGRTASCAAPPLLPLPLVSWFPPAAGGPSRAPDRNDPARAEARERFDRGILLFEKQRDAPGALVELRRAYDLVPAVRTLFMIGLVYAAMDRAVDALRAFEAILRQPGDLTADQVAVARLRRDEQARRVGHLRVTTNVPAVVEVDGVEVARTPTTDLIAVAAGVRKVAVRGADHLPAKQEALVAGGTTVPLAFALAPVERPRVPVSVRVEANVPGAEILVDGQPFGLSPLPGPLALAAAPHTFEAHRTCYRSAARTVELGASTSAALTLVLTLDEPSAPAGCARGRLILSPSEPEAEVIIDGDTRASVRGPLSLPVGPHRLRVVRAGFDPVERLVDVPADTTLALPIALHPTPETRIAYVEHARAVRRWGRTALIAGAVLGVAGAAVTALEWKALSDARRDRDVVFHSFDRGGACYPFGLGDVRDCEARLAAANDDVHREEVRRGLVVGATALGVTAAGLGLALLWLGDDPNRYDNPRGDGTPAWVPSVSLTGGAGPTVGLGGWF